VPWTPETGTYKDLDWYGNVDSNFDKKLLFAREYCLQCKFG